MFGPLSLRLGASHIPLTLTGATRDLLAVLLTRSGNTLRREVLIDMIWPNATPARGRSALNTALWRINKLLERAPGLSLRSFDDVVVMDLADDTHVDICDLRRKSFTARRQMNDAGRVELSLRRALGDLLARCDGVFLEGFESQWALEARAEAETARLTGLNVLMNEAELRGNLDDAIAWGRAILQVDPLREKTYHTLMELQARNGERHHAILTYEQLRNILREELQMDPDPQTIALRDRILSGKLTRVALERAPAGTSPDQIAMPLPQL